MKLLILSHPCVTPINQAFFAEVEQQTQWDITIVVPAQWETEYGPRRATRWPDFQGTLHTVPVWGSGNVPLHLYQSTFMRQLRATRPDAIYVHNEAYAASTAQMWLANRATLNAPLGFYSAQNLIKQYPPPFRWTEQAIYRSARFAFPCSESALDTLRAKGYEGPATYLPLGVDDGLYAPAPDREALRAQLAPDADILFGFVGRLSPEKGLLTLLDALAQLPPSLNWHLALVGTGPQQAAFDARADALGLSSRITQVGFVEHPEVPRYYSAFDLVVLPSETLPTLKEQFGRVIVESLACGTPVLGSSSGEIPRVIEQTGGGITVPERDADALAECLLALARDPARRATLAETGRRTVRSTFTNGPLATRFAETIERAVAHPVT